MMMLGYSYQVMSQSLWNRAMSFDTDKAVMVQFKLESQSLWNRAMSFDLKDL
ncbi:Uncharacterised protein [Pasteurella multocida]|nr:Uncharacterised protein [Pasteurella multocida]